MRRSYLLLVGGLFLLPIIIAVVYILGVWVGAQYRYDEAYFTPQYQQVYEAPGRVAEAMEEVMRTSNASLYKELTGMRGEPRPPEQNPNMRLVILLEVDEADYFQYLFYDVQTYERSTQYVKKVMDRWVLVPQDGYFYLDSGRWWTVITPLALMWWALLVVILVGFLVFRLAARFRREVYRGS